MNSTELWDMILQYIDVITLLICLCIGFAVKYAKIFDRIGNHYIPLIMLILGCIISIVTHVDAIDATVVLTGMVSGLASTGLYEMFRNLLNKNNSSTDDSSSNG